MLCGNLLIDEEFRKKLELWDPSWKSELIITCNNCGREFDMSEHQIIEEN